MTEGFIAVSVFLVGILVGAALLGWALWHLTSNAAFLSTFIPGLLRDAAGRQPSRYLSTVDDEQRLVLIPLDRLCQSLETQLLLWWNDRQHPPTRIHLEPPEGSA